MMKRVLDELSERGERTIQASAQAAASTAARSIGAVASAAAQQAASSELDRRLDQIKALMAPSVGPYGSIVAGNGLGALSPTGAGANGNGHSNGNSNGNSNGARANGHHLAYSVGGGGSVTARTVGDGMTDTGSDRGGGNDAFSSPAAALLNGGGGSGGGGGSLPPVKGRGSKGPYLAPQSEPPPVKRRAPPAVLPNSQAAYQHGVLRTGATAHGAGPVTLGGGFRP